jgi:hypothetical protein
LEKIKPTKTIINNKKYKTTTNIKLNNISIDNIPALTREYIQANANKDKYTYKEYKRGKYGLIDLFKGLVILDDDRNYACTDVSRSKFYKLGLNKDNSKEWTKDGKAEILQMIFDIIEPYVQEYYLKLHKEQYEDGDELDKQLAAEKVKKLEPMYRAITYRGEIREKYIESILKDIGNIVEV